MDKNEKYIHKPDEEKNSKTPPISNLNAKVQDAVQAFANTLYGEIIDENNALKKENEELKVERETHKETIISQSIDIADLKKKLIRAQELLRIAEECKGTDDHCPMFKYEYDLSDFSEEAGIKDIDYLFDCISYLTEVKIKPEIYLINTISDVVVIFQVLTKDENLVNTKFHFLGTLKAFCDYWNTNIVPHIKDTERAQKLTCKYPTVKATFSNAPWKDKNPISWRRLALEATKKKKAYQQAFNIKERTVNLITNKHRA